MYAIERARFPAYVPCLSLRMIDTGDWSKVASVVPVTLFITVDDLYTVSIQQSPTVLR